MALAGLAILLVAAVGWQWSRGSGRPVPAARTPAAGSARGNAPGQATPTVPAVELAALTRPRPEPVEGERDPFRFGAERRPAPPPAPVQPAPPAVAGQPGDGGAVPGQPPPPPPPPPIPLKFVGVVQVEGKAKMAILTDAHGVYYGAEGEAIDGRYRIVRIGAESVEMVYLDGRGRKVIPLSGS